MSFFDDIFGGPTTTKSVNIPASQQAEMDALSKFKVEQALPYYRRGMQGAEDIYNINAPGMLQAAQNVGGIAGQVQETTGGVGESALRTGVSGLQSLFAPDYEANQVRAALQPAQAQYMTNVANQQAQFGGAGNLGSARQALAGQNLASQNQSLMANTAAQVQRDVAGQRQAVGNQLAQIGYGGMDRALAAAQAKQAASTSPTDQYYKNLAARYSLAPTLGTTPYPGTVGTEEQKGADWASIIGKALPLIPGLGSAATFFSDVRLKENIKHVKDVDGIKVYTYNYVWDKTPQVGAMAQDLLNTKYADAVSVHSSGYYQVDYNKLPELIKE
jgi:hypothetical protein